MKDIALGSRGDFKRLPRKMGVAVYFDFWRTDVKIQYIKNATATSVELWWFVAWNQN